MPPESPPVERFANTQSAIAVRGVGAVGPRCHKIPHHKVDNFVERAAEVESFSLGLAQVDREGDDASLSLADVGEGAAELAEQKPSGRKHTRGEQAL